MNKEGKTFFEVFSQSASGKEVKGSASVSPGEDLLVISEVGSSGRSRRSWRGPYRVWLETIVLGAVGGVLLAVGCFFLGLKLGDKDLIKSPTVSSPIKTVQAEKTSPKQQAPAAKVSQEKPGNGPVTKAPITPKTASGKDTWSLRVISYKEGAKGLEKATSLANLLRERTGHGAFVARQGSQIVVCLGEFDSKSSVQLEELQKLVRGFKYEDKVQFAGCYPVKVK
ncbi:MAG: SPOR domain-containing protein [Candidatus Brocadiales bacterium]